MLLSLWVAKEIHPDLISLKYVGHKNIFETKKDGAISQFPGGFFKIAFFFSDTLDLVGFKKNGPGHIESLPGCHKITEKSY